MITEDVGVALDDALSAAGLSSIDGAKWRPIAVVEKFSQDQVDYAVRRIGPLRELQSSALASALLRDRPPSGDELRLLCGAPEEGVLASVGNLFLTAGLNRLTSLLIAAGGQGMTNTATRLGVGNSATAESVGQTDLQASSGSGNRQFKVMDATYPQQSNGVVTAKSTFATGEANFVWNEWGLDIGTPTVADGTTVNAVLFNRKVASLGTKATGAWALTVTATIS